MYTLSCKFDYPDWWIRASPVQLTGQSRVEVKSKVLMAGRRIQTVFSLHQSITFACDLYGVTVCHALYCTVRYLSGGTVQYVTAAKL